MGEFLAAYILETFGVEVHHVDRQGADLWCKVNGSIITVQVKSSAGPRKSRTTTNNEYYTFSTRAADVDWYCFVALDRRLLIMRPRSWVRVSTTRFHPSEFNDTNQRVSIEEMLKSC